MNAADDRAKSVFLDAMEIAVPEERRAFVENQCAGDESLRGEVEALLRQQQSLGSFLDSPPAGLDATVDSTLSERPGTVIGPYKLLQEIGEGGMGVVFLAEQQRPVRRRVALKVVKAGMDTRQVVARFESERQALALMDHPNIAKVFDAGATDTGRPYFVMELVKGVPITRYCDQRRLTPRDRLALFVQVCSAVQHAHTKGIIHRDIKPSNVMVALYDGKPVPKVIDFGVAKATGARLTEHSVFTGFGSVVGTPEYMSPEQAELNQLDVDTRSDVYSLGVLLYELLTGSTPVERGRFKAAALLEMLRVVREEEAPRPSTRLSTTDRLASIAASRGLEPRKLSGIVRGELDWIVMRCLEKDRSRRYETANGLARDVERYLNNDAVQACPPSAVYRLGKFARRNKGPVTAGALILLALVAGMIGTTIGFVRAQTARKAAVAREAEARAILDFVEKRVFAAAGPRGQADPGLGRDVTLRAAIEAALPFIDSSFPKQPQVEASLRMTVGRLLFDLGEPGKAAEQFQKARTLYTECRGVKHVDTLLSMRGLAGCYLATGRLAEALGLAEETFGRFKATLGPRHPDTLECMECLGGCYHAVGRYADTVKFGEETVALFKAAFGPDDRETLMTTAALASYYDSAGRYADALRLREETLPLLRAKFGPDDGGTLVYMSTLAGSYTHALRHAEAMKLQEEVLTRQIAVFGADHPATIRTMNDFAIAYSEAGRHTEALKLNQEAVSLAKARLGPDHPDTLRCMGNLAVVYFDLGRHADALLLQEQTLALERAKLGPEHPQTIGTMNNLANSYGAVGRHADALKLDQEALALHEARLGPNHPDTFRSMMNLAESLVALDRGPAAVAVVDECLKRAAGRDTHPGTIHALFVVRMRHFERVGDAAGCRATAEMFEKLPPAGGDEFYSAACWRAVAAAVAASDPKTPPPQASRLATEDADRAMVWLNRAVAAGYRDVGHIKTRDPDMRALRGRDDFKKLIAVLEESAAASTDHGGADAPAGEGKPAEAEASFREAIRLDPNDGGRHHNLGDVLMNLHRPADAAAEYAEAVQLRPGVDASHYALAGALARGGLWDKAAPAFAKVAELNPDDFYPMKNAAVLYLYANDLDNYRRTCRTLLDRFGRTDSLRIAGDLVRACALSPGFGADPTRVLKLADTAAFEKQSAGARVWFDISKAMAYYRAGRFESAADVIVRSAPSTKTHRDVLAFSVLAMARHRLGQADEARAALAEARQVIAASMPKVEKGETFGDDWHDWLHARILFRETEQVLKGPAGAAPKQQ